MYTIGEISKMMNLSVPTLRYYDDEGLLFNVKRDQNGNRIFNDTDVETLILINCLKTSGMKIKEIKQFIELCKQGNDSLLDRYNFFIKKEEDVLEEIKKLENTLAMVKYKQWYYKTALDNNDENIVRNINVSDLPENIKELYFKTHKLND